MTIAQMKTPWSRMLWCISAMTVLCAMSIGQASFAQENEPAEVAENLSEAEPETLVDQAAEIGEQANETVAEIADKIDQSETAKEISAGILSPIYQLAESLSFGAFHWLAFALMVTGVVSFALQLVLGKLVALSKASFSVTEIISDATGLIISLIGLVLTTQAAAENSGFTNSAASVLSATVIGGVFGFLLYIWGQRQELQAVTGRVQERREAQEADQ